MCLYMKSVSSSWKEDRRQAEVKDRSVKKKNTWVHYESGTEILFFEKIEKIRTGWNFCEKSGEWKFETSG